ncbi:MAG: hypothetical protein KGK07_07320 [Chloroflexota bacterium]|nr:hypothetical protein [Chloroflexota bacterium]
MTDECAPLHVVLVRATDVRAGDWIQAPPEPFWRRVLMVSHTPVTQVTLSTLDGGDSSDTAMSVLASSWVAVARRGVGKEGDVRA